MNKLSKAQEAFKKAKFKQALGIVEKINKSKTAQSFSSWEVQAAALAALKLNVRAKEAFKKALVLAPDDKKRAKICFDLFSICSILGAVKEAEAYIKQAIAFVPASENIKWRMQLASLYFKMRRYDECEELCVKLLVYKPYTLNCMNMLMDMAIARTSLDKVDYYLRQFEGRMGELNGKQILGVYARVEAYTTLDFSRSIDKAISRGANPLVVKLMQASRLFKDGLQDECFDILSEMNPKLLRDKNPEKRYYELMGKISDKRKEYNKAFDYFRAMNALAWEKYQKTGGASKELYHYGEFDSIKLSKKPYTPPAKMFFLVGFPRSGTTLLENIIDTQERVLALPERPMLDDIKMKIKLDGYEYPNCLQDISDEYLDEMREYYFLSVLKNSSYDNLDQFDIIVDKNPINSIRMPFIKLLFPDAKVILALRHPLDSILSCFMQNFGQSPHLADFSDWASCFKRYKDTFDIYEGFKNYLEWDEYQVKYENLVENFEHEVESILNFLGVEADRDSYMGFNKRAKSQVITTPSGSQVRQGIYKSASQRWVSYKEFIEPHIDEVRHHIDKFGYSANF